MTPAPLSVSAEKAGPMLGLHPKTVLRMAQAGTIPHFRHGRRVLFSVAALDRWVAEQVAAAEAAS